MAMDVHHARKQTVLVIHWEAADTLPFHQAVLVPAGVDLGPGQRDVVGSDEIVLAPLKGDEEQETKRCWVC